MEVQWSQIEEVLIKHPPSEESREQEKGADVFFMKTEGEMTLRSTEDRKESKRNLIQFSCSTGLLCQIDLIIFF